eukprot:jgi/Bigna1/72180/fgenesh1_pg.18_\
MNSAYIYRDSDIEEGENPVSAYIDCVPYIDGDSKNLVTPRIPIYINATHHGAFERWVKSNFGIIHGEDRESVSEATWRDMYKNFLARWKELEKYTASVKTFSPDSLSLDEKDGPIGEGKDANIFVGTIIESKRCVAVKTPRQNMTISDIEELKLLMTLPKNNCLVDCLGVYKYKSGKLSTVLELCEGGSMFSFLRQNSITTHRIFLKMALDMVSGLTHLHLNKILHRDVAARNFLLRNDGSVVISDLTNARKVESKEAERQLTLLPSQAPCFWQAPETIPTHFKQPYKNFSVKSDVWAMGVTLWEMLNRANMPYISKEDIEALKSASRKQKREMVQNKLQRIKKGELKLKLLKWEEDEGNTGTAIENLIYSCLHLRPQDRPSAAVLKQRISKLKALIDKNILKKVLSDARLEEYLDSLAKLDIDELINGDQKFWEGVSERTEVKKKGHLARLRRHFNLRRTNTSARNSDHSQLPSKLPIDVHAAALARSNW